ncbi:hypothetical protein WAI453_001702 [Rhynchosporium graminicola]
MATPKYLRRSIPNNGGTALELRQPICAARIPHGSIFLTAASTTTREVGHANRKCEEYCNSLYVLTHQLRMP